MSTPETAAVDAAAPPGGVDPPAPDCHQQNRVLMWLGVLALIYALTEVGVAAAAIWTGSGDGLNAVREDVKGFEMFVLGVLATVLTPHVAAALGSPGAPPKTQP